jgi:hypothetical protein
VHDGHVFRVGARDSNDRVKGRQRQRSPV